MERVNRRGSDKEEAQKNNVKTALSGKQNDDMYV